MQQTKRYPFFAYSSIISRCCSDFAPQNFPVCTPTYSYFFKLASSPLNINYLNCIISLFYRVRSIFQIVKNRPKLCGDDRKMIYAVEGIMLIIYAISKTHSEAPPKIEHISFTSTLRSNTLENSFSNHPAEHSQ